MVALIAAADPDGPESVTPTATLETRLETPGSGLYAEIRSASGESIWRSPSTIGTAVQFGPPLEAGERQFLLYGDCRHAVRLAVASRGIVWDNLHGKPARFTFSVASSLEAYEDAGRQLPPATGRVVRGLGAAVCRDAGAADALAVAADAPAGTRDQGSGGGQARISWVKTGRRSWYRSPAISMRCSSERTRVKRYRDTLGNLAHSLKTPLAVMRQALGCRPLASERGARYAKSTA